MKPLLGCLALAMVVAAAGVAYLWTRAHIEPNDWSSDG